eukprot:5921415-Prymnesium_polylepis.1
MEAAKAAATAAAVRSPRWRRASAPAFCSLWSPRRNSSEALRSRKKAPIWKGKRDPRAAYLTIPTSPPRGPTS